MISVFISHNYMDKPLARKISNTLNYYGIQTWIDESEIKVGDSLIAKIRTGIDDVDYLIALISKYSVESEWVLKELDIAMNKEIEGKKVIVLPVLAGECELPGFLKGKLYVDMSNNKNYTKNLPKLLSRFNIDRILPKDKLVFTNKKIALVEILQCLSNGDVNSRIKIWKSLSYSDKQIITMDEFSSFFTDYIQKDDLDETELVELLKAYDRISKNDNILLSFYVRLLNTNNELVFSAVIDSIIVHKATNRDVVSYIIKRLASSKDNQIIISCLHFLCSCYINIEKTELLELLESLINTKPSRTIFGYIVKVILFQFRDDDGIRRIVKLYSDSDDKNKKQIINAFSTLGSAGDLTSLYIRSPRLRDEFKKIILDGFSEEDDLLNADLICALFVTDELEYIFPRTEIWETLRKLDNYSVLAFLERINYEYNANYIFNSVDDVFGFSELLKRADPRISEMIFEILADISLKASIDVLVKNHYKPKNYNVDNILITLLKETNLKQYEDYYLVCRQIRLDNCDEIERLLIQLCDYTLNGRKIDELISSMQFDCGRIDMRIRNRKKILKFICDILNKQIESFNENDVKAIKQFTRKAKRYYLHDEQ